MTVKNGRFPSTEIPCLIERMHGTAEILLIYRGLAENEILPIPQPEQQLTVRHHGYAFHDHFECGFFPLCQRFGLDDQGVDELLDTCLRVRTCGC